MTLLQLEQFIKDNIQQPLKAAIIIDAVRKYSSASNGAKPIVSGWRAFEDELPKANELIMIVWPSNNYQPEFRILTEDDLKNDWSMMRWCPVPAYG
jgi:hypothetical protein